MTHNNRCALARGPVGSCQCSCRGTLHGSGISETESMESPKIEPYNNSVTTGIALATASVVFPATIPIYKAYSVAKIGKRIYDSYNGSSYRKSPSKTILSESIKYKSSEVSQRLSETKAQQTAKAIRLSAETAGIITQIAKSTHTDPDVYGEMLEGSIKNGILHGIGNMASYATGGLI